MNRPAAALLCACLLLASAVTALAHTATAQETGESRYKALRLTPEVYANASPDLSDLRLYDAAGEAVPYFIRSGAVQSSATTRTLPLRPLPPVPENDEILFDFVLLDEAGEPAPADEFGNTSLVLFTDAKTFAKEVRLLGSRDGKSWQPICETTLYRVDGNEQLEIPFPTPQRYAYYRLVASNNLENITFQSAELLCSEVSSENILLTQQLTPDYTVEQRGTDTVLTLSGLKNLRLLRLELSANGMFQRDVSCPIGREALYQLTFSDVAYRNTALELGGDVWLSDTLEVTIANFDDKPLDITGITVFYAADELIFEGGRGPYTLRFGEPLEPPRYDIENYRTQVQREQIDALSLSAVTLEAPAAPPPSAFNWQAAFNVAVVAAALVLGFVILARIRKN